MAARGSKMVDRVWKVAYPYVYGVWKNFCLKKSWIPKKCFVWKIFGSENLRSKKFGVQKYFTSEKFCVWKHFGSQTILIQNNFSWVQKNSGSQKNLSLNKGWRQKKHSIFKDIIQIEVDPFPPTLILTNLFLTLCFVTPSPSNFCQKFISFQIFDIGLTSPLLFGQCL